MNNFQPFHALQTDLRRYPSPGDLAALHCEVNVCSTEHKNSNVFYGDVIRQEHLPITLSSFAEGFLAFEKKEDHWIHSLDLLLYLSQATLYSSDSTTLPVQIEGLDTNISRPLPLLRSGSDITQINLWMNISAVCSGLHYDQYNNILVLLRGRKVVSLVSPSFTAATRSAHLLASGVANHATASSAAELVLLGLLAPHDVHTFILNPGDAIFIPEGWWHDVSSDECSLALNFWFHSPLHQTVCKSANTDSKIPVSNSQFIPSHMTSYVLRASLQALIVRDVVEVCEAYRRSILSSCVDLNLVSYEDFESFMFDLHSQYSDPSLSVSTMSTIEDSRAKCGIDSMEDSLVNCSHITMSRLWPIFAERHPLLWAKILSELRPISACSLTASWDSFKLDDNDIEGRKGNFFSLIFDPLEDQAAAVRTDLFCASSLPLFRTFGDVYVEHNLSDCFRLYKSAKFIVPTRFLLVQIRQHLVMQADELARKSYERLI